MFKRIVGDVFYMKIRVSVEISDKNYLTNSNKKQEIRNSRHRWIVN